MRKLLLIFVACVTWAQVTTVPGTGGSGSITVTAPASGSEVVKAATGSTFEQRGIVSGAGVICTEGTDEITCVIDDSVVPTKAVGSGVPTMAGQLAGAIAVDSSGGDLYTCLTDDGTDCTSVLRLANYAEVLALSGGTLTGQLVTDNLGIEFEESDTNPTCAAGNFNIYADASENKLKACQNGTPSDLVGSAASTQERSIFLPSGFRNTVAGANVNYWSYSGGITVATYAPGVLMTFPDAADTWAFVGFLMPNDWNGGPVKVIIHSVANQATAAQTFVMRASVNCVNQGAADGVDHTDAVSGTFSTTFGSGNELDYWTISSITARNCTAGERGYVGLGRLGTDGADASTLLSAILSVELRYVSNQ